MVAMVKVSGGSGAQSHLLWLGPSLLQFEPILVENCHIQRQCKIIEVGCQNGRRIMRCGQKLVIFEAPKYTNTSSFRVSALVVLGSFQRSPKSHNQWEWTRSRCSKTPPSSRPFGLRTLLERAPPPVNEFTEFTDASMPSQTILA